MDELLGMFGEISRGLTGGGATRIARDEVDGLIVSTVDSGDMGPETAVIDRNGTHPVERYESEDEARKGHVAWVENIRKGVRKVTKLGYGRLIEDEPITLHPDT